MRTKTLAPPPPRTSRRMRHANFPCLWEQEETVFHFWQYSEGHLRMICLSLSETPQVLGKETLFKLKEQETLTDQKVEESRNSESSGYSKFSLLNYLPKQWTWLSVVMCSCGLWDRSKAQGISVVGIEGTLLHDKARVCKKKLLSMQLGNRNKHGLIPTTPVACSEKHYSWNDRKIISIIKWEFITISLSIGRFLS